MATRQPNKSGGRLRPLTLTAHGQTKRLTEWSRQTNIPYQTIRSRLSRGWTADEAVGVPVQSADASDGLDIMDIIAAERGNANAA